MRDWAKYNEDPMPELLPLDKKNTNHNKKNAVDDSYRSKADEKQPHQPQQEKKATLNKNTPELETIASKRNEQNLKRKQAQNKKKNEISKNLIHEMMNKISLKSVSEENYPITNETIHRLLSDLDDEISLLKIEINKFQNALTLNSANQHLKKEIQVLSKAMNQLTTIKDLYLQKIENRTKISDLQSKIGELKIQNRELKIKISRGIEKIESHIHNLPCQKQKQLIEEVNKYKISVVREKQMRENLENDIKSIVLNFKRFYIEADQARKIVTDQLKGLKDKQHKLNAKIQALNHVKIQKGQQNHELRSLNNANYSHNISDMPIRQRRNTNRFADEQNIAQTMNQPTNRRDMGQEYRKMSKSGIHDPNQPNLKRQNTNHSKVLQFSKSNAFHEGNNNSNRLKLNLQEQIEKMRVNQHNFSRLARKQ